MGKMEQVNPGREGLGSVLGSLRISILPGNRPPKELIEDYKSAYAMWQLVWSETFRELDGAEKIYSDDFCRQDEIICVFREQSCLAMAFMRWVNFDLQAVHDDSYFKVWPKEALEGLGSKGPNVIVCSNLTVHPLARGNKLGVSFKDVMAGLCVERLVESGADVMTGTMRVDRGMNKATFAYGARLLLPNLIHHNVPVDLVAFFRDEMIPSSDPVVAEAVQVLWNFRRDRKRAVREYKIA